MAFSVNDFAFINSGNFGAFLSRNFSSAMIFSALVLSSGVLGTAVLSKDIFAQKRAGRECDSKPESVLCEDGCIAAYDTCNNKCSDQSCISDCQRVAFQCIDCEYESYCMTKVHAFRSKEGNS